jgi:hypothetical protein
MVNKFSSYVTNTRAIRYAIRHPKETWKSRSTLLSKADYVAFVRELFANETNAKSILAEPIRHEMNQFLSDSVKKTVAPDGNESPMRIEECMSLYATIRLLKPNVVIETGISAGRSSSFLLSALYENNHGELWSIDPDPRCGYAVPSMLRGRWHQIVATSNSALLELIQTLQVDLFIHDSLHTYQNMIFGKRLAF